ncbi:hypothetical protein [Methylobacterium radiotolerans]|uniref:hypothetical protein n=1 Tax=Methylobacterium radiotolerans TaxID=31998 RepID=UPI001F3E5B47|nr:hypothetical protein [Methylobacterium radiotolerans]UIY45756.1 hypothetical protein LZ599_32180 [Methylobacterium radiotolerans]
MSRRPNVSQTLAMKAAAAAAREVEQDEAALPEAPAPEPTAAAGQTAPTAEDPRPAEAAERAKAVGRPKGRRPVAARQTVYLDDARHAALARIAEDRGRSIHSLILEGIDHVIGKPTTPGWQ